MNDLDLCPGQTRVDPEPRADLERKVDLCRQLLAIGDILDRGRSQFRGLILFDLFLGQLGLALAAENTALPQELSAPARAPLRRLLEESHACLAVESGSSHGGRVAAKAAAYLARLQDNEIK